MIFAADSDAHRIGIGDHRKHMTPRRSGKSVGVRDGLQADSGDGKDQVEVPAGNFPGDRVCVAMSPWALKRLRTIRPPSTYPRSLSAAARL